MLKNPQISALLAGVRVLGTSLAVAFLAGPSCLRGPSFMGPGAGGISSNQRTPLSASAPAGVSQSQVSGTTVAKINSQSAETQEVAVPNDSDVSGTKVGFPPGSLSIDTVISIQESTPVATATTTAELGIQATVTSASKAVSVQPTSSQTDPIQPFTVTLSLPGSGLSEESLNLADGNIFVVYRVYSYTEGKTLVGVIPSQDIEKGDRFIRFYTRYFGAFQAAYSTVPVTKAQSVTSTIPVQTKKEVQNLPPLTVTGRSPVVVPRGGKVIISGQNFRPTLAIALGGKTVGELKVMSDSQASFVVPADVGFGLNSMELVQDGTAQTISIFYKGDKSDFPIMTEVPENVCSGSKYYDQTGALKVGTKSCQSAPAAASCSKTGETNCLASTAFPAVASTELAAGNIKKGASIGGVTGIYPSSEAPLATNTTVADLTSFGPTSPVGTYEFFDSAGNVYPANILDGGTITPSTVSQSLSATGSLYRGVTVSGNADLLASNIKSGVNLFGVSGSLTPAPANCSTNNASGCVTTATYKSADWTNLTAANIKNGVSVAGLTGTYPSSGNRLASNTATTDLTSFGSGTTVGAYEFFDSAGSVYSGTVADGGTVTPTTSNQTISAAGTFYRSVIVQGDANLTAVNIKDTIPLFGVTGTLTGTPVNCSSNGQQNCLATATFFGATQCSANGSNCFIPTYAVTTQPLKAISYDAIDAGKSSIRSSLTLSGIAGTLADCTTNDTSGCVTTASYKSADWTNLTAANIKTGASVAGLTGTYPSASNRLVSNTATADLTAFGPGTPVGAYEFFDSAGDVYPATVADGGTITPSTSTQSLNTAGTMYRAATINGDSDLVAGNILSGTNLFGVNGSVTASPATCGSNGSQSCVATGSYYAATACAADGSNCFVPTYVTTTQPLKAISYDAIDAGKSSIRTTLTLSGVTGTLADCTTNNTSGCVTTASYKSADWTNLTAANIKNGASVAGLTGTYPSSVNLLTGADGTADLDQATFDAKVKGASTFEFFGPDGTRYTNNGDADITAANIASGVTIFGTTGTATILTQCTSGVQATCESDTACRWHTGACEINPWHIRAGVTVAYKAGSLKANCRNTINSTYYNWDGPVTSMPNSAQSTGTAYDFWDTIDDYSGYPANKVTAWSTHTQCDSSNWTDVTTTNGGSSFTTCGTSSTCIYRDELSGLRVTGILSSGNNTTNTATPTTYTWSNAVKACAGSTYGGYGAGTWRLPTQKELMSLYEHGIASSVSANFHTITNLQDYYWSSSTNSLLTTSGLYVILSAGFTNTASKTSPYKGLCVF